MVSYEFDKVPIVDLVNTLLLYGINNGASDIHFDPCNEGLKVRYRFDGELNDHTIIPKLYYKNLTTRIKLLAGMNITETRLPQDGAIKGSIDGTYADMRVSSLPTNLGEKIVIRILDYSRSLEGIENLGFSEENLEKLKKMIAVPNGIILVTGATGSGKSTTTYSILNELNKEDTNIITVEDPIEMNIEGINQVQVNSDIGLTFATTLRSILRQDPNIILIGEIRDSETAQIAVRASITGHLVLSTIHTNNSLTTIERLIDMNVQRYLLSSSLTGIISQRLAKKLCDDCKIKRPTSEYEKMVFKKILNKDVDEIYDVNVCDKCHNGYKGRIAIQEVLYINDEIRDAINSDIDRDELKRMVYKGDVITMLQDGLQKVIDGLTTFEEIYRIIEIDDEVSDEDGIYLAKVVQQGNIDETTIDDNATTQNDNNEQTVDDNTITQNNNEEAINNNDTIQKNVDIVSPSIDSGLENNDIVEVNNTPIEVIDDDSDNNDNELLDDLIDNNKEILNEETLEDSEVL